MVGTFSKPRICLLADRPNWAFDYVARSIASRLSAKYRFRIAYRVCEPHLHPEEFDLLYVFFWGEDWYKRYAVPPSKIIKEVASLRWQQDARFGRLSAGDFAKQFLGDCAVVTTPTLRIGRLLRTVCPEIFVCSNGYENSLFRQGPPREGPLQVGWVGNPADNCKGLHDILLPACGRDFRLCYTPGNWSRHRVARLYRCVHVIAIASTAESQPLPLVEGMASGCFPVATEVGIVPELVDSGKNGLIVGRSVEAFRQAFRWCSDNLDLVRREGAANARLMWQVRRWDVCAARFAAVFDYALGIGDAPAFYSESDCDRLSEEHSGINSPRDLSGSHDTTGFGQPGVREYLIRLHCRWGDWRAAAMAVFSRVAMRRCAFSFAVHVCQRLLPYRWRQRIRHLVGLPANSR